MRLTTNKPTMEMTMLELACNCVYAKDNYAYYRDYNTDEPLIDFIMNLSEKLGGNITTAGIDDVEAILEELWANLNYPLTDINGIIAFIHRNLEAIGELREKLKTYEDLEEKGKLLKLPCAVGDTENEVLTLSESVKTLSRMYEKLSDREVAVYNRWKEYEEIGTVSECQKAMEKQRAKKPNIWGDGYDDEGNIIYDMYDCPNCGKSYEIDYTEYKYCPNCGQAMAKVIRR